MWPEDIAIMQHTEQGLLKRTALSSEAHDGWTKKMIRKSETTVLLVLTMALADYGLLYWSLSASRSLLTKMHWACRSGDLVGRRQHLACCSWQMPSQVRFSPAHMMMLADLARGIGVSTYNFLPFLGWMCLGAPIQFPKGHQLCNSLLSIFVCQLGSGGRSL